MDLNSEHSDLYSLFDENFLEYTAYVIRERAIPDMVDGLKPVQRRILQTLANMDDGRYHKVANVVGSTMKLHPHGDASIFAALVNLANKGYLIDRQGNFGNIFTGDSASAARYIECRLSPLAREILFNKDLTEYIDSYDGRMQEPLRLPAKLPMLLMQGAEGIAVGMATKIMPHNFRELLEAQIKILKGQPFEIYPDFSQGGLIDVSAYNKGNGRLKCRARLEEKNDKTILVREIPYGTTTQSLMESIEKAARLGKIKILSINDFTAEEVEIEIKLARGVYAVDTIKALYAFTDCEIPITPNLTVIRDNQPVNISVDDVLEFNTAKLVRDLRTELEIELDRLREKLHAHLLEQIFIEERLYKRIEECATYKLVLETINRALAPFSDRLPRPVTPEDIEGLLEIRIKRISRYDIDKKRKDINKIKAQSKKIEKYLKDMVGYTINYLEELLKKYGPQFPRRTEIKSFHEVEVRKVALSNLVVGYDQESGFLGHLVKSEQYFSCSEYDRLLLIFKNGMYKVINVVDKLFVGPDLLWVNKMDEKLNFNIVYRDGRENLSYIKRFSAPKYILNKEYNLFPEHKNSFIQFLTTEPKGQIRVYFAPSKRAKKNYADLAWNDFLVKGLTAKGKRISPRVVRRVADWTGKTADNPPTTSLFDLQK